MPNKTLILHGYGGKRIGSWLYWLHQELIHRSYTVSFPEYKNVKKADFDQWSSQIKSELVGTDLIVGHSFGALMSLYLLSENLLKADKAILVAPATNTLNSVNYLLNKVSASEKEILLRFFNRIINWKNVNNNCAKIVIYLSDDHVIPFTSTFEYLKEHLPNAKYVIKTDYGHFNEKKNIFQLPEVLNDI